MAVANEAAVTALMQKAAARAQAGDVRLLQVMNTAIGAAQQGNTQLLDKVMEIAGMKEKPQEMGFFGRLGAALFGGTKQGVLMAAVGAGGMGAITYGVHAMGQGKLVGTEARIDSKFDQALAAQLQKSDGVDYIAEAKKKLGVEGDIAALTGEQKTKFDNELHAKLSEKHSDLIPKVDSTQVIVDRMKISAIFSGIFGALSGAVQTFTLAPQEREQERMLYAWIHEELPAQVAQNPVPQGQYNSGFSPTPNLPRNLNQQQLSLS